MKEYRCTRNALYSHQSLGQNDLLARQGYYIEADSQEEAWQRMALKFPSETAQGFTVSEWEGFNVIVTEIRHED